MIIGGGKISKETLLELFDYEQKAANLDYAYKRFYSLTTLGNVNLSAAESEQKSGLYRILKDNVDFLTIQPVLEYFSTKSTKSSAYAECWLQLKPVTTRNQ